MRRISQNIAVFGLLFIPALLFSQITDPHIKWRQDGVGEVKSMTLEGGALILETAGGPAAFDPETGKRASSFLTSANKNTDDASMRLNLKQKNIAKPLYILKTASSKPLLILAYKDELTALDPATLSKIWNAPFSGNVSAPPASNKSLVLVPTKEGTLFAFDLEKGQRRWEYFIGISIPYKPEAAEDAVYLAGANDFLYGVNLQGRELWRHQCGPVMTSPIYRDGVLYAVNKAGTVYAFKEHEGDQNLQTAVEGEFGSGKTEMPKQARVTNFMVKREIKRLAEQLAAKDFRPTDSGRVVAVLLMNELGTSQKGLNEAFTDMLIEAFADLPKYTVVERTRLDKIMEEQKLGLTGAVDPKTAVQLGRLVAANRIVTGSVASVGDFYELNARMTETETGILIRSSSVQVRKDLVQTK